MSAPEQQEQQQQQTTPPPDPAANGRLLRFHEHQLRASAIDDAVAAERGYASVSRPSAGDSSPRELLKRLGIPAWARDDDARFPGLLIPMYRATGERIAVQYRPDNPVKDSKTGKIRKYAAAAGRASVLDVHPRNRNAIVDPTVPLWITEGVKKADCLTSRGQCAVAPVRGVELALKPRHPRRLGGRDAPRAPRDRLL